MSQLKVAIAGVGNNISALLQGVWYYRGLALDGVPVEAFPGLRRPKVGPFGPADVDIVAAFDVQPEKVGQDLARAIVTAPNNYPVLGDLPLTGVSVARGMSCSDQSRHVPGGRHPDSGRVRDVLMASGAEVLLYSLPTGMPREAEAYAQCALDAGIGFVNCTPDVVARNPGIYGAFAAAKLPIVGDDLASHLGSSVVHKHLLELFIARGITLESSYQLNLGGNEDFRNLLVNGASKAKSKKNALSGSGANLERVQVVPSAAHVPGLKDNKVGLINVEGAGWAGTPVTIDLKLKVQDSSNAAGVIIDLLRFAGARKRAGIGGMVQEVVDLLKSPAPILLPDTGVTMADATPHATAPAPFYAAERAR